MLALYMMHRWKRTLVVAAAFFLTTTSGRALADPTPVPSTSPRLGWSNSVDGFMSFVDQAANGPGITPPEGAGFARGNPLSPMTPYDTFASTPNTPGIGGIAQAILTTQYASKRIDASLQSGVGHATGSITNDVYWTEPLMATLNPHVGSQALPYSITFPTHAGQDDGTNTRASILAGSVGGHDGSWLMRGGWFNLNQGDRFVFAQPPLTSITPAVTVQPAESLGNGAPSLDAWPALASALPLQGVDLTLHEKSTTLEVTNAALPTLPGSSARITLGSIVLDRGGGTRFSGNMLHLATSGNVLSTTVLFGANAKLNPGAQGELPTSFLGGQSETIAGLRGAFHWAGPFDGVVEVGRAWYDAHNVLKPGTATPGGYYHVALIRTSGHVTTSIEGFRFEPRYATAYLPYGVPENIWSVAWSWPGIWLKSTYQLVDNTVVGANRQGYRLRYALRGGPFEARAAYGSYQQIETATTDNGTLTGFVEGFFLPQQPGAGAIGQMHQYAAWIAWHAKVANLTIDYVDDTMHRDFQPAFPQDSVSLNAPQVVYAAAKSLSKQTLVSLGFGRFAMRGSWAQGALTNVNYAQDVTFAGAQVAESQNAVVLLQLRSTAFSGLPSIFGGPSPNYHGTTLIVDQHFHI